MKKSLLFLFAQFFMVSALWCSISISGELLDQDGIGVADHPIALEVKQTNSESSTYDLTTDANGAFSIDLNIAPTQMIILLLSYENCNGSMVGLEKILRPGLSEIFIPLTFCADPNNRNCKVRLKRIHTNAAGLVVKAIGIGAPPFEFEWSDGSTGDYIAIPENGEFCVTMTDSRGCTATACSEGNDNDCIVQIQRRPTSGLHGITLHAVFRPSGDSTTYLWNTGDTTPHILVTERGKYCVRATGIDGCVADHCVFIGRPQPPNTECTRAQILVDYARDRSHAELSVRYPSGQNLHFQWSTGETTDQITVSETGVYTVIITDRENNCRTVKRVYVNLRSCQLGISVQPLVNGYRLTLRGLESFGSGSAINIRWSTGQSGRSIVVRNANTRYCAVVTSENCREKVCIVPGRALLNRSLTINQVQDRRDDFILLYASSKSGEALDVSWSDGTSGPYKVIDSDGKYTAYGVFSDGTQVEESIDFTGRSFSEAESASSDLAIWPNPASGQVYIGLSGDVDQNFIEELHILDIAGRIVEQRFFGSAEHSTGPISIEIDHLLPGYYTLGVKVGGDYHYSRLIIN